MSWSDERIERERKWLREVKHNPWALVSPSDFEEALDEIERLRKELGK